MLAVPDVLLLQEVSVVRAHLLHDEDAFLKDGEGQLLFTIVVINDAVLEHEVTQPLPIVFHEGRPLSQAQSHDVIRSLYSRKHYREFILALLDYFFRVVFGVSIVRDFVHSQRYNFDML